MTEMRPSDLRTARAHYNGEYFTVLLDHWTVETDRNNVYWLNQPDDGFHPEKLHTSGVLLTTYQVRKDNDPTWRAEVQLSAPEIPSGRLRITSVTITANELDKTALPLTQIRDACVRVGGVLGVFHDVIGETSGFKIRSYQISAPQRDAQGELFHPDEIHKLTGKQPPKKRGYRKSPETLQQVWDALNDYQRLKIERRTNGLGKPDETQPQWVARVCGLPESNVQKQINDARKKYGATTKNNEETK
jgi:hypothetical protein